MPGVARQEEICDDHADERDGCCPLAVAEEICGEQSYGGNWGEVGQMR